MEKDFIYTAGLIDGEGTIGLVKANKNQFKSPYVSVSSTTFELVDYLKNTYGGYISKHKVYQDHHKQSYSWKINFHKAIEFIKNILPYLKEPEKIRRANLIINEYSKVTKRNGKYSSNELKSKLDFEYRFFHPSEP